MDVALVVLTIAVGTAVMAALIVAADWDLAVIRAWHALVTPQERPEAGGSDMGSDEGAVGWHPEPWAPTTAQVVSQAEQARAEAWLAAAAARRLEEYRRADPTDPTDPTHLSATPLRLVLAARRDDRRTDRAA